MLTYEHLGAFTPVTMEDNVVVDGVLASCCVFDDHDLAHLCWNRRFAPLSLNQEIRFLAC